MRTLHKNNPTPFASPLSRTIPKASGNTGFVKKNKLKKHNGDLYKIEINLEAIHYTGNDYGYGWTFVISTMQRHWLSSNIQLLRGKKSLVNKVIYQDETEIEFNSLQHLPIVIFGQHNNGNRIETTLRLTPNSFKKNATPKSIYTEIKPDNFGFKFHELHTVTQDDAQFMFVLQFDITPESPAGLSN